MTPRVVITGMGVVSPNAIGKEAFCRAVLEGRSGVGRITRFDTSQYPVHIAGEVKDFDELAWVEAKERKHLSRGVPLTLAAATEALADAGLDPRRMSTEELRGLGVMLGTGGGSCDFSEQQYKNFYEGKKKQVSVFTIASGTIGTMASEISMRFGLRGLSQVVTSGCASSTDAMGHALREMKATGIPMMLAGGVDTPLSPLMFQAYCLMRALTSRWNQEPERASRPFSRDRDGFVLAEGCWLFLFEDLEHARARGARIYAEVAGYGSSCEAFHRVRLAENGEEPARAIRLALQDAGISPDQVDYVNLHGTSTELNDRIETRALKLVLGERAPQVPMSSLKSEIGHAQGASGAAGLAATLVAMEHGQLPPTINL